MANEAEVVVTTDIDYLSEEQDSPFAKISEEVKSIFFALYTNNAWGLVAQD